MARVQGDTFLRALPGRKGSESGKEDVSLPRSCCHKPTLAKKLDGTIVLSQTKEKYYKGHGEMGKVSGLLNWKGLFVLPLRGQRTDRSNNRDEHHSYFLYKP